MTPDEERLHARQKLANIVGCADDEAFLLMVWGVNALQSGNPDGGAAAFPFGFPPEAVTEDMSAGSSIYPWELETLVNELLASPKSMYRTLSCNKWGVVPEIVNALRRVDDLDFLVRQNEINIFQELYRISGRQFDWQRGYFNPPQFYRNIFIYGQGKCAEYFYEKYGITVDDLVLVGFAMFSGFMTRPNFGANGDFELLGLSADLRDKALSILAAPLPELRRLAASERAIWDTVAYRPSVLRRYPCVRFGRKGWRIRSPLPALILERITSGLFYDVISGGGAIRNDYGRRFEDYALRYLRAMLPEFAALPESHYKIAGNRFDTPDIIVSALPNSDIELAIECKASRMSFGARFADEPAGERGYDDIVKAIFQLWRYFSHCRRGRTGRTVAADAVGLVLTLDSWMVMGSELFDGIFARAVTMAEERDPLIEEQDRRPIAFSSIPDFEAALTMGTGATLLAAVRVAAERDRRGGYLEIQHEGIVGKGNRTRHYPFHDLASMLPWWGLVEEGKAAAELLAAHAAKPES